MKINYNRWFYDQHRYTEGTRDNKTTFNDTKWKNMNQRIATLMEMHSSLVNDEPYGIVGNFNGLDKLVRLLKESNYTFQDLNDSLVKTYQMSLKNAMSKMVVNTHAIIASFKNTDKQVVSIDSKYYFIDVPYDQLTYGDRDETIRQNIDKMYSKNRGKYVHMTEFLSEEILRLLGFAFICTTNGFISNDWMVALDEKGMHFKIAWERPEDCEFIIYKLDKAFVLIEDIPVDNISSISAGQDIIFSQISSGINTNCIIDIYNPNKTSGTMSAPNFGICTPSGLTVRGISKYTLDQLRRQGARTARFIVYGIPMMYEVADIYPAIDYYDMMYSRPVYTDKHEGVYTVDGNKVIGMNIASENPLNICTPPIVIDRNSCDAFKDVMACVKLKNAMLQYESIFKDIGNNINVSSMNHQTLMTKILTPASQMNTAMKNAKKIYDKGAIITSMISMELENKFNDFLSRLGTFVRELNIAPTLDTAKKYAIDEFYANNYRMLVSSLTKPFTNKALEVFQTIDDNTLQKKYMMDYDCNTRFNRPISEQCFITLRWNTDEECWVFTNPSIKHFKGIQNAFYIDKNELKGNEVFKFFILYTDTEAPGEKNVDVIPFETVYDYDEFIDEVNNHIGYIKFWNIENHLQKLSKIYYDATDTDKQIQVLSEMLQKKLNGEEFLNEYNSEMNYEPSNATTDNISAYDENSERGPFTINFLFYTLNSMFDNTDQLISYLMNSLSEDKYANRYSDIDISSVINENDFATYVNFSSFTTAPTNSGSITLPYNYNIFYGIPYVFNINGVPTTDGMYRYTFTQYPNNDFYLFTNDDNLTYDYKVRYSDTPSGYRKYAYGNDVELVKKLFEYIHIAYDYINFVETNYTTTFANNKMLEICKSNLQKKLTEIRNYIDNNTFETNMVATIEALLFDSNVLMNNLDFIIEATQTLAYSINNQPLQFFFDDSFLAALKRVYVNTGFDDYAQKRIRALYLYLKKINTPMNLRYFINWVHGIDKHTIDNLSKYIASNSDVPESGSVFDSYALIFDSFYNQFDSMTETLENYYDELTNDVPTNHISPLLNACYTILTETSVFPLYSLNEIEFTSDTYANRPYYATATVSLSNDHFHIPSDTSASGTATLVFKVNSEYNGTNYVITQVTPVCDYTFFDGTDLTISSINIFTENQVSVGTLNINCKFIQVGNTGNKNAFVKEVSDALNTLLEFNNAFEKIIIDNNNVISEKQTAMNYELLAGRYFKPLEHVNEYVLDRATMKSNSVDMVSIDNVNMNNFAKNDYNHRSNIKLFFKPVQVQHLTPDGNNVITGVGKGYFVGQKLYVKTNDANEFVFPIIVTAIDHSIQHGIIEAYVDYQNADWFKVPDNMIADYLTQDVECEILGDNICNFLDTFSGDYKYYNYPKDVEYDSSVTDYTLPGDPIFVLSNPDYIYTRISWMFNDDVKNRFYDEPHKMYDFIYIGNASVCDSSITINTINHNFNTLTNPELYPVLRTEPNDHYIWKNELLAFEAKLKEINLILEQLTIDLQEAEIAYEEATTDEERMQCKIHLDEISIKIEYYEKFKIRIDSYIKQQEIPTTWYNVNAYEDAMVYINNGRAKLIGMPLFNIRDIDYTDAVEILLYDWEHKCWLNPNSYTITKNIVDAVQFDDNIDGLTDNVLHSIEITFDDLTYTSRSVLIYFAYRKSDVFDSITSQADILNVKFKPALIINNNDSHNLYENINVRKHFDTEEYYKFTETSEVSDFSGTGYLVKRIRRSGQYPYSSIVRMEDVIAKSGDNTYTVDDFDVYFRFPFNNVDINLKEYNRIYNTTIKKAINSYTINQIITLICIQSDDKSYFDGNLSTVMFTAKTGNDINTPSLTIIDANMDIPVGKYLCTVAKDPEYPMESGVIEVNVQSQQTPTIMDSLHKWYKLNDLNPLKIVPDEMIFVPHNNVTITDNTIIIGFKNNYVKDTDESLDSHIYYYDTANNVRYPISNIHQNDITTRTEIDLSTFTDVKKIKSNYIGICRYSLQKIPKNGIIDFTGYIPTPLSRERYEFWVNGRFINNTDCLTILSPTSIQLKNLTSLRNFELIELVDDNKNSIVSPKGSVYIDLNGNYFASYQLALLSNAKIRYQYLNYKFYGNIHNNKLDQYSIVKQPNNINIEPDILEFITDPNAVITSYFELYNIPTLNGALLKHPMTADLGITEIPADKILELYDKIWKKEITTISRFPITHKDLMNMNQYVTLHITELDNGNYLVNTKGICDDYFTLYIANTEGVDIDNNNVIEIIPMIKLGTAVVLDSSFAGKYLHCTFPNTTTIQI